MGNSPGRQALEEFARTVRVGDVAGVDAFLRRVSAARGPQPPAADKLAQELRTLDLNKPLPEGLTALQLAASCGRVEVVRFLLDSCGADPQLPDLSPNAEDSRRRTALHFAAAFTSPPNCAQCVADLLSRQADPCIADCDGRTALDVARSVRCSHCVRTIEDKVKVWQGWVDHDEHVLLQLPNWRPRWLVVCQDRYPNTGPWHQANSVSVSCYNCRTVLKAPPYAYRLRCSCCGAEVAVTTGLQLAIYDASWPEAALPTTPMPSVQMALPTAQAQISAKALEDAGIRSFAGALLEGKLRRALQSTGGTSRTHGLTMKIFRPSGTVLCEHSFRVASAPERDRLVEVLRDPARAAYEAAVSQAAAPTPPPPPLPPPTSTAGDGAQPPPPPPPPPSAPWSCARCTYAHAAAEASLSRCAMCGLERGAQEPPAGPASSDGFDAMPEPSAPPLLSEDCPPAPPSQPPVATEGPGGQPAEASAPPLPPIAAVQAVNAGAPAIAAAAPMPAAVGGSQAAGEDDDDDDNMCAVCMERPKDTAVVPCGHMCGCFQCLQSLRGAQGAQCPICRGPVTSTMRIYKS